MRSKADVSQLNLPHGFTFLVLAHPGSPGKRAVKPVCVYVCVRVVSSYHHLRGRQAATVLTEKGRIAGDA